jgi:outer membrane protein
MKTLTLFSFARNRARLLIQQFVSAASLACAVALGLATPLVAQAQELKIGLVNSEKILKEINIAKQAQERIEAEFSKRDKEVLDMGNRARVMAEKLEKDSPVLAEAERNRRQRELTELDRDWQRKRRELGEDLNQRRNEEFAGIQERIIRAIKQLAEAEKFDLIVQDAVYFSNRVDITDRVIRLMNAAR